MKTKGTAVISMSSTQQNKTTAVSRGKRKAFGLFFFLLKLYNSKNLMKDLREELLGGLEHIYGPTTSQTETKPAFSKAAQGNNRG